MRLSVITDEISQDLEAALEVCEDSGVGTVELRAVGGANIISHDQSSLKRIKATLEDKDFDVCAISSPFLKCHLQGDGPPGGATHFAAPASREEQWDILERSLDVARLLGALLVRTFSFWRVPDPAGVRGEVVRVLTEAVECAEAAGLTLALRPSRARRLARPSRSYWGPTNPRSVGSA